MEEDLIKLAEYGAVGAVSIALTYLWLKYLNRNSNGYDRKVYEQITTISSNHLNHIEQAIKDQTESNNDWHRKQLECLIEIKTILNERR